MSLLACENREEYLDFGMLLKDQDGLVVLDLLEFYSLNNQELPHFDCEIVKYSNPFKRTYGQLGNFGKICMNFYISSLVLLGYFRHSNGGRFYTGISLFAFRFASVFMRKSTHISYIRSVFMPRKRQLRYTSVLKFLPGIRRLSPFHADEYWVLGDATKKALIDLGVRSRNIKGFLPPQLAGIAANVILNNNLELRRIVFVMGAHSWHGDSSAAVLERNTIKRLRELCADRKIELVLRAHPRGVSTSDLNSHGYRIVESKPEQFLHEELTRGSLLITNFSMMGMEYDYIGGQSIYILDDETAQYLLDWISATGATYYCSVDQVFNAIDRGELKYLNSDKVYFKSHSRHFSE